MWQPIYTPPYYDFRAIEEKNPSIAILLGARGLGKTNYYKRKAIYNFLNTGKKTIFMKRFKKEVKEFRNKFLNDIYKGDKRLKKVKIELKGNHIYIEGKQAIEFISLSQSIQLTGVSYEDVTLLVFDEFLTLGQTIRGIKEETLFLHFLETCFRDREDFKIVMLSNAVSTTSNYFMELGFNKPINPNLKYQSPQHTKDIIVEVYDDIIFKQHKEESKLYKLFSRSQYKKFAIENEFILEDNTNILNRKNIKGHIKELFTIATSEGFLNVALFDKIKYFVYYSKSINNSLITFDKEQIVSGATYITNNHLIAMNLTSAIISKLIFYNDMKVKKQFLENLKKLLQLFIDNEIYICYYKRGRKFMKWIKLEEKRIIKNNCFNRTLNFFNIEGLEGTKKINDLERVLKDNKINYVVKDFQEKLTKNKIGILLYDFKTVLHIQPFIDNNYYDVYPSQLKGKPCKIILFKGYKRESR